jgi:hypothetical protein
MDPRRRFIVRYWLLGAAVALAMAGMAHAAQLNNCSQTVAGTAAAVPFPAAGSTGPTSPQTYLEICNAHATNTLGVNATPGGTAAIGSAGTLTLNPGGCLWWNQPPIPTALSVIGSAGSTTTACWFQ